SVSAWLNVFWNAGAPASSCSMSTRSVASLRRVLPQGAKKRKIVQNRTIAGNFSITQGKHNARLISAHGLRRRIMDRSLRRSAHRAAIRLRRQRGHGLPGWDRLRLLADQDRQARDLTQTPHSVLEIGPEVYSQL